MLTIKPQGDEVVVTGMNDGSVIRWHKHSHTAVVTATNGSLDVFTFAWEKNNASMLDFTIALNNYLDYSEE